MQRAEAYNLTIGRDVLDFLLALIDTRPRGEVKQLAAQLEAARDQQDQAANQPAAPVVPIESARQVAKPEAETSNAKGA